ncbi:immunoglobulin a1 protease [Colletotrichum higginsianum]|nr:immunoglobulin a1 protease [Colletotrichum higginsianum]
MVTTTTSFGSDDPTIVPIIVPIGKPPVICWGCVTFPANVQFKLPEFCVQILGFRVGNCPDDNSENKNGKEKENENEERTKTTTTTTSCSTTVTATYASVFCTVTLDLDQPERRRRDEGCSTLEYETKTACETITGATTTTATTVKPEPTICSPGTCGEGACPVGKKVLAKRAPPGPKSQPNAHSWFGPEHYTNKFEFMRGETYKAYQDPSSSVNLQMEGTEEFSTGKWAAFGDDLTTVAVAGLWGCTSVIAVSKRGVWVSHFWERRPDLVLATLGDLTGGVPDFIDEGLGMFRGKAGPNGNMFDDDAEPQVFIVTRKERPTDMFLQGAPGDVALLALIRAELDVWWRRGSNHGPQREMTYDPIIPEGHAPNDPRYPGDPEFFLFRGKAMIQYQPAIACGGGGSTKIAREAGYRVWVEAEKLRDGEKNWKPSGNEQIRTLSKRQESCPVNGNPGGDNPGGLDGEDDDNTPPPKKACSSNADCSGPWCTGGGCSGPECTGGRSQYLCEEGFCVCKAPQDPSICTTAKTCGYLDCNSRQDKACADGSCKCVEKTCSNVDACGFLRCSGSQEKACTGGRCSCKDRQASAFVSGLCNTHIRIYGSEKRFSASITVYDGSGAELYRNPNLNTEYSWGETIMLNTGKLPYALKYEFLDKWLGSTKKRDHPPSLIGPNPLRYQTYSVRITAGNTIWSTMDEDKARKMVPRCEVGNWDTHGTWDPSEIVADFIDAILGQGGKVPTRDMDCRWRC